MIDVPTKRVQGASPLRYPGGKSALTGFLTTIIRGLGLENGTYVEPYAGGAGAALALLDQKTVDQIVINDLDPAIHAFWNAVVNHNASFLEKFDRTDITLDEWNLQKAIYRAADASDPIALGFATYFLNRTNRSGVLNAGVIGGKAQQGTYRIDARFAKTRLRPRLEWIGTKRDSITVTNHDGLQCLRNHLSQDKTFTYADPPYFEKGSLLYLNAFTEDDHADLAAVLNENPTANWLLSYDNAPEIRELYEDRYQQTFNLSYSAHRTGKTRELLVASAPVVNTFYDQAELAGVHAD